ncbi:MAG: hypothetical protein ACRDLB_09755 [Actinomycetota bacterium]
MEADISGSQRKVVTSEVVPTRRMLGDSGIPVRNGRTLPFRVARTWSAPAGTYLERFYIIDPRSREVLYEGPAVERSVWGLQSLTEFATDVRDPISLAPGSYAVVFSLGRMLGGEVPVEAFEVSAEEAA